MATFKAKVDATFSGQVWIDETEITNHCTGFIIKSDAGKFNTVVIRLMGMDLDLELIDKDIDAR